MKQKILPYLGPKLLVFFLALLFASVVFVNLIKLHILAGGWDWEHSFLPATQAFMSGKNPYETAGFYNPPWLFLITVPFALLPGSISALAVGVMNVITMAFLVYRLKVGLVFALIAVLSPPVIWGFLLSNIDWLVLAGMLLPPQIGLFFVLIKPQVGLGIALYWLYQSWKEGKLWGVIKVFSPVTAAYLISFLVYGFYLGGSTDLNTRDWNTSFFPYSIIIGLFLIVFSVKKLAAEPAATEPAAARPAAAGPAAAAAPFFSPYVGLSSWSITVLGLIKYPWLFFTANIILWIYFILNKIVSR